MQEDPVVAQLFSVVQDVRRLRAENERLRIEVEAAKDAMHEWRMAAMEYCEALHRISHSPNGPKTYCRDGHEEAVLIARAALGEEK